MSKEPRLLIKPAMCMRLLICLMFAISSFALKAQIVSGTVSNKDGEKLVNVTVSVKGTTAGTNTNADGQFTINTQGKTALVFTSVLA